MSNVTPIDHGVPGSREHVDVLERRTARLLRRFLTLREPVIWLRAGAGAGKSHLVESVRGWRRSPRFDAWVLLDDPSPAALENALADFSPETEDSTRLLIASRPGTATAAVLLRQHIYGGVAVIDDGELFVTPQDVSAADDALLAATGGWPMLVSAHLHGRIDAVRELLPAFLDREVLPGLPEPLVAAAFAALAGPLSTAAFAALCDGEVIGHPLFRLEGADWRLSSTWVHEALLVLRSSSAALTSSVRQRLRGFYSRLESPERTIVELAGIGEFREALEVFKNAGGVFFGCRHGYRALETVLRIFEAEWEPRVEELYLARLWLLIKSGKPREALLKLEARHPNLPVDLRPLRLTHRAEAVLLRIDIALDLDETPPLEVIASWGRLQSLLPARDDIARGLLYNSMAIGFLQADSLAEAKRLAEESLAAYEAAGSPYLAHCMHLHLCDVAVRQGRLNDASRLLQQAERALEASGHAFNSEPAIVSAFKSRIAFEEGRIEEDSAEIEPILSALLEGDSWPDLILRLSVHFVLTGYWKRGLRYALERLDQCALTLSRRHGYVAHRQLALLRIRLMQVARHHAEADMLMEEYDLEPTAGAPPVEEGLIRLRQAVVQERSRAIIGRLAETLARRPQVEPRQRISLAILQAAAFQREDNAALARRHLRVALREADSHNLVAVLLEDGEFLERLLPGFIAAPGPGNARLAQLAVRLLRPLKFLPTAPLNSKTLAGVSRQEHRVLSYVADGYTNKQIGRALTLSESTVKFHRGSLFKKLDVATRGALADAARDRGIAT
jgi:DNA-binding CsgD family transcriptional regulator/tetratricopeptide (TPR) repeat protein